MGYQHHYGNMEDFNKDFSILWYITADIKDYLKNIYRQTKELLLHCEFHDVIQDRNRIRKN